MSYIAVAIDGPSGAGKSTIAKMLARELGYMYVDTGALYRAIGLYMEQNGIAGADRKRVTAALERIKLRLSYDENGFQRVYLNEKDVSEDLRTPRIAKYASEESAIPEVRDFLLEIQRDMARQDNVIMDGRDIGTVILPDAEVKIFLTASAQARAYRRYQQLRQKGQTVSEASVLEDMMQRDRKDADRAAAPLKQAEDAVLVDTSNLSLEESVRRIRHIIETKLS